MIYRGSYSSDHFICNSLNECKILCIKWPLNDPQMLFYRLQDLFISMQICIVVIDAVMTLPVPVTLNMKWHHQANKRNIIWYSNMPGIRETSYDKVIYYIPAMKYTWYNPFSNWKIHNLVSRYYHHPPYFTISSYKTQHLTLNSESKWQSER